MRIPVHVGPPPAAPYSPAIVAEGKMAFLSGQLPFDPDTGELRLGTFREQAELVFANVTRLLHAAGADWSHVVRWAVYLADLRDFAELNDIARRFLVAPFPARTTIGAILPPRVALEIDCIAVVPAGRP